MRAADASSTLGDGMLVAALRARGMSRTLIIVLVLLGLFVFMPAGCGVSSYNRLVGLDQAVQSQWAQVENAYQRRLDLVPNLVETVKGAAAFEKDTFTAVTEARSRAVQATSAAGLARRFTTS